jgi:hypothetical protein
MTHAAEAPVIESLGLQSSENKGNKHQLVFFIQEYNLLFLKWLNEYMNVTWC